MTEPLTDLQAALRKACEDAAKYLPEPRGISDADVADIIERHLTPVFEALRDSMIEECAEIARPHEPTCPHGENFYRCDACQSAGKNYE